MDRLSVVGLGKLGQCFAAVFAAKGFETTAVDIDEAAVASLQKHVASVQEPGLQELIDADGSRLRATRDYAAAIRDSDLTFIIVPTPSDPEGTFSNRYVEAALAALAESLRSSDKPYHLFVLNSTVMPGSAGARFIPLIEKVSGRTVNAGFGFCYAPAFIALGDVIKGLLRPDLVVIGQSDDHAGRLAEAVYRRVCENEPPVFRTGLINIELMKLSLNCYVTLKISFANTLANLCERTPGADVDVITRALGADRRIGPHYLRAGLGYGGPCFPRDGRAMAAYGRQLGVDPGLFEALGAVNAHQHQHLEEVVLGHLPPSGPRKVAVLGLAYKPNTPVIDESPGVELVRRLLKRGVGVVAFDPLALDGVRAVFGDRIEYAASVSDCVSRAPVCVVATPADEFKGLHAGLFAQGPAVVIDCWRVLDPGRLGHRVTHVRLGNGRLPPGRANGEGRVEGRGAAGDRGPRLTGGVPTGAVDSAE